MKNTKYSVAAALSAGAVCLAAGPANAAPTAPAPTAPANPVQQLVDEVPGFVQAATQQILEPGAAAPATLHTPVGSVAVDHAGVSASNTAGQVVATVPAPRAPQTAPNSSRAQADAAALPTTNAADAPDPRFKTWNEREQWEWNRFTSGVSLAATVGTATGAIVGGVTGCAAGVVVGAPSILIPVLGPVASCAAGAALLGTVGAATGALLVTAPAAIALGANYVYQSQIKPFTPPK